MTSMIDHSFRLSPSLLFLLRAFCVNTKCLYPTLQKGVPQLAGHLMHVDPLEDQVEGNHRPLEKSAKYCVWGWVGTCEIWNGETWCR